jgi:hypothetical protein
LISLPFASPFDFHDDRLEPIAALCRRIALQRLRGETAQARQLEAVTLPSAVQALRTEHGPELLSDNLLGVIRAREQLRVADAALLAELLGALRDLSAPVPAAIPVTSSLPAHPTSPPALTDLLDDMLAQEAADRRARHSAA